MKGGTYTKTLAKIQVSGIFRIRDIRRNVLPRLIEVYMETAYCSLRNEMERNETKICSLRNENL